MMYEVSCHSEQRALLACVNLAVELAVGLRLPPLGPRPLNLARARGLQPLWQLSGSIFSC